MKEFQSVNDIIDFAIGTEQDAVDFYNKLASQAKTDDMRQVFTLFAQEEMAHKARLTTIRETGIVDLPDSAVADLKIADYAVAAPATPEMSYADALILAMKREKSAFKLYSKLAERAPGAELKALFMGLAQEESRHKLRFELEYDEYVLREN